MTIGRLLLAVATAASLALGLTGFGLYQVANEALRQQNHSALRRLSETAASGVEHFIAQAANAMDQHAMDPQIAAALKSGDSVQLIEAEDRLTRTIPGAALVRIVPDGVETPDEKRTPRMGFADLDVIRQSRTGRPIASVHVAHTADVHIAIARRLLDANGTLLASLAPAAAFAAIPQDVGRGAMEFKQGEVSLSFVGDPILKARPPDGDIPIQGTDWQVLFWGPPQAGMPTSWFWMAPILGSLLTGAIALWLRRISGHALLRDGNVILKTVNDLLAGKIARRGNLRLQELQNVMVQLAALKPATPPPEPPPAPKAASAGAAVTTETVDLEGPLDAVLRPVDPILTADEADEPDSSAIEISPAIFRSFDILGVVGDTLTPPVMHLLGSAIGTEAQILGQTTIALARDARPSSSELAAALARGIAQTGCTVVDIGQAPITTLYYAGEVLNSRTGVMVGGGHEPPEYNGLKVELAGERLSMEGIWRLRERIKNQNFQSGAGKVERRSFNEAYIERIASDTQVARPMKLVLDCANSVTANVAPALFQEIGCEVIRLFCDLEPGFPNHPPDPMVRRNLEALIRVVREQEADLGVTFDADGDRLAVVDSSGLPIRTDRLLMLLAADVLSRQPGADIVFDVRSTRHLAGHIVRHGGRPLMWKPDRAEIIAKLRETGALLAGDINGRLYFMERWYGFDDGLFGAARLLEILSLDPRRSSEVFATLPDSVATPELVIPLQRGEADRVLARVMELADFPEGRISDIDGLRVDFADGFGLVRPSDTEPALMLRFEADTPEALNRILRDFKSLLKKARPNIVFPTLNMPH